MESLIADFVQYSNTFAKFLVLEEKIDLNSLIFPDY